MFSGWVVGSVVLILRFAVAGCGVILVVGPMPVGFGVLVGFA